MIKVFSFVGSCAEKNSSTLKYSDSLAEVFTKKAAEIGEEVIYKKAVGSQLDIKFCKSCASCFMKGVCPLDSLDDMAQLKKDFLDSDIIFFGTPVYIWEMSGITKCVIDRIAYWSHTFELTGKIGVVYAVTDTSKAIEVSKNLTDLLRHMGLIVVKSAYAFNCAKPNLHLEAEIQPEYEEISSLLLEAVKNPTKFITPLQEASFISSKNSYLRSQKVYETLELPLDEYDVNISLARGIGDYASFKDFTIDVMKRGFRNDI